MTDSDKEADRLGSRGCVGADSRLIRRMHMKPQKTTSCQIYAEKKQNWKLHTFCFLNILKSNSHVCFEKKIHRNHSGLNARSSSVRKKEKRGEGREQHFQGDFQGSEWFEWSPS